MDRVGSVKTLVLEGKGTAYNLGQDMSPETTAQTFVGDYVRRIAIARKPVFSIATLAMGVTMLAPVQPPAQSTNTAAGWRL